MNQRPLIMRAENGWNCHGFGLGFSGLPFLQKERLGHWARGGRESQSEQGGRERRGQQPAAFRVQSGVKCQHSAVLQPGDSCAQPSGRQELTCTFLLCRRERDYAPGVFHFQMFLQRAFASHQHGDPTARASSWGGGSFKN